MGGRLCNLCTQVNQLPDSRLLISRGWWLTGIQGRVANGGYRGLLREEVRVITPELLSMDGSDLPTDY